jgi:hypothetical protein
MCAAEVWVEKAKSCLRRHHDLRSEVGFRAEAKLAPTADIGRIAAIRKAGDESLR